jgi:hypothetical protein
LGLSISHFSPLDPTRPPLNPIFQRYLPGSDEIQILASYIHRYFQHIERSPERRQVSSEAAHALHIAGYCYSTDTKVRIWFRNNRKDFPDLLPQQVTKNTFQSPPVAFVIPGNLPPLPAVPNDGALTEKLAEILVELTHFAKQIPRALKMKPNHPTLFADVERNFLACLRKFPPAALPSIFHSSTTIIVMDKGEQSPTHPLIQRPSFFRMPPSISTVFCPFYKGHYSSLPIRRSIKGLECAIMGFGEDFIYTYYDDGLKSHEVAMSASHTATGFVSRTSSLLLDGNHPAKVWIAGDFRVRAFNLDRFQECDLLYVGNPEPVEEEIITKSALAIWDDFIVLGHGQCLTFWKRLKISSEVSKWSWNGPTNPLVLESAIERRRGRTRAGFTNISFGDADIDCLAIAGAFLTIASSSHPSIHLIQWVKDRNDFSVEVICRFIGHTMGITKLVSSVGQAVPELFSGSKDGTIKQWSVNAQQMKFSLHVVGDTTPSEISSLYVHEWKESPSVQSQIFLFAGHIDGRVRVWDLTAKRPVFELKLEPVLSTLLCSVAETFQQVFDHAEGRTENQIVSDIDESGQRLIPKVIGFIVTPCDNTCELIMIGVYTDEEFSNGEYQSLEFAQ